MQLDIGVGELGGALAHAAGRARPGVCARRSSSLRRRIATSALSARLGTDTLIMKVSSSRNDSLSPICRERAGLRDRGPDREDR